jgi:hypothetical protein
MLVLVSLLAHPADAAKRVLYTDSHHEGFAWGKGKRIAKAIQETLQGHDVILKIHHMDTDLKRELSGCIADKYNRLHLVGNM